MNPLPANRVPVGPWSVVQRLTEALATHAPYLCLDGGEAHWVAERARRWTGTEVEAVRYAEEHGGAAVPAEWISMGEWLRRRAERESRRAERCGGIAAMGAGAPLLHETRKHRHDRTGEEVEG